jgi:hypothetical protein
MRRLYSIITALVATFVFAACTTVPIMNVDNAAVPTASGKPLTKEQVRSAIIRAGGALGWQMKDEGPDKLVGTLVLRTHTAVVEIPYSTTNYSIKYRSSIDLNESGGNIHKNYNGWIQNLNRGINTQLGLV